VTRSTALAVLLLATPALAQTAASPARTAPSTSPAPAAPDIKVLQRRARAFLAQDREAEAVAELRRAAALGPLDRDLALKLAGVEQAAGNAGMAERQLRSLAERFHSVQALLQLARLQSSRRDPAAAVESLARARALAPNSEEVLSASAQLSLALRAPVPAILALEPLARMCPTVAQYPYLLGVAFMQAGDMQAAVAPLRQAEGLEPTRALTLVALGLALNAQKAYADARTYLARAVALAPEDVEAVAALAEAEDGLGETEAAEAHAQRALARNDAHATANLVLGLVRMKQERYADARDALVKAAAGDPASPKAHYQLSLAYARLGDAARAEEEVGLYQQKLREIEQRVNDVRAATGVPVQGTTR
jgi:tetratricopeptide (TPR) repeat protein